MLRIQVLKKPVTSVPRYRVNLLIHYLWQEHYTLLLLAIVTVMWLPTVGSLLGSESQSYFPLIHVAFHTPAYRKATMTSNM